VLKKLLLVFLNIKGIKLSVLEGGQRVKGLEKESFKNTPLISIITVVYNGEEFLEGTIQSVINQDYKNIEYIIIDGGSTDGTIDIIKKYESQIDCWVSESDHGIYDAMNKGVKLSTGSIVGIINADDYYSPNIFNYVVNSFEDLNIDIVHGDMNRIDRETGSFLCKRIGKEWKLLYSMSINHPATFVRKVLYNEMLYSTSFKIAADYDYFLHAKLKDKKFCYISKVLVLMRDGGVSKFASELTFKETKRVRKENLPRITYILTGIIKLCRKLYVALPFTTVNQHR
jgi:glycosyltransferase involved in cell wall biosynthesis